MWVCRDSVVLIERGYVPSQATESGQCCQASKQRYVVACNADGTHAVVASAELDQRDLVVIEQGHSLDAHLGVSLGVKQ